MNPTAHLTLLMLVLPPEDSVELYTKHKKQQRTTKYANIHKTYCTHYVRTYVHTYVPVCALMVITLMLVHMWYSKDLKTRTLSINNSNNTLFTNTRHAQTIVCRHTIRTHTPADSECLPLVQLLRVYCTCVYQQYNAIGTELYQYYHSQFIHIFVQLLGLGYCPNSKELHTCI